jgi:hypothetical protein
MTCAWKWRHFRGQVTSFSLSLDIKGHLEVQRVAAKWGLGFRDAAHPRQYRLRSESEQVPALEAEDWRYSRTSQTLIATRWG